ncbi:apolipoprotein N-acyltransferase [Candidatus Protofrankia datiscae]|uniref:Apolipoprotein N-acyltransferase n=3 Tax=Protofrankia TaxID=2994361 RepID=F8B0K3_9ACTN|nr:apolipoprotein N-acyltransferase [Candidatus Protofrankia datiscae]AEH09761.1 Apolipoprotein N-acyltransferase [Candidatus Protofrankia datiscae]
MLSADHGASRGAASGTDDASEPDGDASSPQRSSQRPVRRLGRRLIRPLLAATAGVLLYLAFPPAGIWPLAPVAVALLTLVVRGVRLRRSFALGLLFGLGFMLAMLRFVTFVGIDGWVVLSAGEAALLALVAPASTAVTRVRGWPLWVAAVWVAQEAVRARVPFGGFPWGKLAFSQADTPLTPLAALGGSPLVTTAVAGIGALLAAAAIRAGVPAMDATGSSRSPGAHGRDERTGAGTGGRSRRVRTAVATARPLAAAAAVTLVGLAIPLPTAAQTGTADIAAVQGNVPRAGGLDALGRMFQVTTNHVTRTEQLAADVAAGRALQPDLVLWPENASDVDPLADPRAAALLDRAARAAGAPVLVGAVLDGPGPRRVRNAALVWEDTGWTGQMYVKQHPVPFAEYLPGRAVLEKLIGRFATEMPNDFVHGTATGVLTIRDITVGDVICFEVAYDGLVRAAVDAGAQLLVVQTNNASFGRRGESEQQLAMTRLRAVEHGRAAVQVSTSGQSAMVMPDGRIIAQSGLYQAAILTAALPLRTGRTVADRLGSLPETLLVMIGVVAVAFGLRAGRREQDGQAGSGPADDSAGDTEDTERSRVDGERVLVCVPTYNERENLQDTVNRLRTANPDVDVLVIDDASPDGTGELADELATADPHVHVLHRQTKEGLGAAYVAGFNWGLGRGYGVLVEMDADGSHQPEELPRLLTALRTTDLVIGSRWVPGGEVRNWPRARLLLSRGANVYVRTALGMPLADATAGFRAYRAGVLRNRDLDRVASQGYCFQVDLAWQAWRSGFRVGEVPITFVQRERGRSKMSRAIVGEALWRVTWWAVRSLRDRPAAGGGRGARRQGAGRSTAVVGRDETGPGTRSGGDGGPLPLPAARGSAEEQQERSTTGVSA